MKATCLALLYGALLCRSVFAEDDAAPNSAASVKFDFAQYCIVGSHKFILESSTLSDVVHALGDGHIVNTSSKENVDPLWAIYYVCGKNVVRFEADGDMGGDEHRLTGVSIGPASEFSTTKSFPTIIGKVAFSFGEIGMKFSSLEQALGSSVPRKNIVRYKYEGKTETSTRKDIRGMAQAFDVSVYMSVRVDQGKVVSLGMSHITTF